MNTELRRRLISMSVKLAFRAVDPEIDIRAPEYDDTDQPGSKTSPSSCNHIR